MFIKVGIIITKVFSSSDNTSLNISFVKYFFLMPNCFVSSFLSHFLFDRIGKQIDFFYKKQNAIFKTVLLLNANFVVQFQMVVKMFDYY